MEDLAVFTALNHSGSFGKNFVKFKKNKYVIYRVVKNCDLGHSFSLYGPSTRQITYISYHRLAKETNIPFFGLVIISPHVWSSSKV